MSISIPRFRLLHPRSFWNFWVAAFLLRVLIAFIPGGNPYDQTCFKAWGIDMLRHGPAAFYTASQGLIPCDYPPLYPLFLGAWAWLYHLVDPGIVSWTRDQVFAMSPMNGWFKLPGGVADLLNGWLVLRLLRPLVGDERATSAARLILFNPLFLYDSVYWGQMDAILLSFFLLVLWALRSGHLVRGAILGAAAVLLKPQGLFLLPFALLTQLGRRHGGRWPLAFLGATGLAVLLVRPFWPAEPVWTSLAPLLDRMRGTADGYPVTSLHAFNLHALTGMSVPDSRIFLGLSQQIWGLVFVALVQGLLAWRLLRPLQDERFFLGGFLSVGAWFLFATRMHERYFIPAIGLLTLAVVLEPRWRRVYVILCTVSILNLLHAQDPAIARILDSTHLTEVLCLVNLACFAHVTRSFLQVRDEVPRSPETSETPDMMGTVGRHP